MKQVYAPQTRKVCLLCKYQWVIPVVCAQLVLGTTANLLPCEHCVAVGTAADTLRHLSMRVLHPICD
jgi:hypothetical protein